MNAAFNHGFGLCALLLSTAFPAEVSPRLLVKSVSGPVRTFDKDSTLVHGPVQGELLPSGSEIRVGEGAKAVFRFHPDHAYLDAKEKTAFSVRFGKEKDKAVRRVLLRSGDLVLGVRAPGQPLYFRDAETTTGAAESARWSFTVPDKAGANFVVLSGEISLHNRPRDIKAVVRAGQKAVSDGEGIRITDATDAELEEVGLRQNLLEVDFWNPQTEEFSTLEVEYEGNF